MHVGMCRNYNVQHAQCTPGRSHGFMYMITEPQCTSSYNYEYISIFLNGTLNHNPFIAYDHEINIYTVGFYFKPEGQSYSQALNSCNLAK